MLESITEEKCACHGTLSTVNRNALGMIRTLFIDTVNLFYGGNELTLGTKDSDSQHLVLLQTSLGVQC